MGSHRFPKLSNLARDTFVAMGSSEPSESAFYAGGQFERADRGRLLDTCMDTMVKHRSWNRFLGVTNSYADESDFELDESGEQESAADDNM